MTADPPSPVPIDPRVRLAAERTLLAWVRTGLALMGFGFIVARFGLFLREMAAAGHPAPSAGWSRWFGVGLVLLGISVNLLAAGEHVRLIRRMERGDADPFPRRSLGVVVTLILAGAGVAMVVYLCASDPEPASRAITQ